MAFSVSDRREVTYVVGDNIVGVATKRAMIKRIIFRIRREFSSRGFGYLLTALSKQIDESPRRISRDFETPQDLAVLGQNLLAIEPGEDFRIITPSQHEPQFWSNASFQKQAWNHIKLVVSGTQMRAYVNSKSQPTLAIPRLEGNVTNGRIAFGGEAIIADLVIKPNAVEGLSPLAGIDPTDNDPRYLRHWQVSQSAVMPKGIDFSYDLFPKPDAAWTPIAAERRGLINLTRKFGKSESRRIVWLKTKLKSESAQTRKLAFGFSDEVWALINGKMLYVDKNLFPHPIRKEPDGRCSIENTTFNLPLNAGDNELLIGVANDFYGWGIVARIDSLTGITLEN